MLELVPLLLVLRLRLGTTSAAATAAAQLAASGFLHARRLAVAEALPLRCVGLAMPLAGPCLACWGTSNDRGNIRFKRQV